MAEGKAENKRTEKWVCLSLFGGVCETQLFIQSRLFLQKPEHANIYLVLNTPRYLSFQNQLANMSLYVNTAIL